VSTENDNIKIQKIMVGLPEAEKLLGHNISNRRIKRRVVLSFADDMTNGRWKQAGAPLIQADDGTLLDGQHRLLAVIESGCTIEFLLVTGVERDAQPVIDTGTRRSLGDVLVMRGEPNAMAVAAITRIAEVWDPVKGLPAAFKMASTGAQLEFLNEHPELHEIAHRIAKHKDRIRKIRPASFGVFLWLIEQVDAEDADAFIAQYISGTELAEGSPILALRNYADNLAFHGTQRGSSLEPRTWLALMIKAWNAWRDGREMKLLTWKRGGANPEPFPIPH
jgi:hypothetical protein